MYEGVKTSFMIIVAMQFAAKICLLTSFRDTCFIEIVPRYQTPTGGNSTYNDVRPVAVKYIHMLFTI